MRINIRIRVLFAVFLAVILSLAGCAPLSRSHIEKQVDAIITVKYKFVSDSEDTYYNYDSRLQRNKEYQEKTYYFKDENGVEFTVKSLYYKGDWNEPVITNSCDYAAALHKAGKEAVDKAVESDLPDLWFDRNSSYTFKVAQYEDIGQAAASIEKMLDAVPPLTINRKEYNRLYPRDYLPNIYVNQSILCLGTFYFLCDGESPLTQTQISDELQYKYADYVKLGKLQESLPGEALSKYPVSVISDIYLNGDKINEGIDECEYSRDLQDYVFDRLDPCHDFEGRNYLFKGTFSNLVNMLGGAYECDNWKAKWTIGDNSWSATVETEKSTFGALNYKSMTVYKNGEKINLSEANPTNMIPAGRMFTLSDLEKMLGVTAEINQSEMTINFH